MLHTFRRDRQGQTCQLWPWSRCHAATPRVQTVPRFTQAPPHLLLSWLKAVAALAMSSAVANFIPRSDCSTTLSIISLPGACPMTSVMAAAMLNSSASRNLLVCSCVRGPGGMREVNIYL